MIVGEIFSINFLEDTAKDTFLFLKNIFLLIS